MLGCIIQARTGSSRLPGKVLMKLDNELTVLEYVRLYKKKHQKYHEN